jgi:hypothetical protein
MANINLTFTTTTKQDAKLAKVLLAVNAQRVQQELPPFATIEDYFKFVLVEAVKGWVAQQSAVDAAAVGNAYEAATDAVKAQVAAALGL